MVHERSIHNDNQGHGSCKVSRHSLGTQEKDPQMARVHGFPLWGSGERPLRMNYLRADSAYSSVLHGIEE
jgi:hypothetical protein